MGAAPQVFKRIESLNSITIDMLGSYYSITSTYTIISLVRADVNGFKTLTQANACYAHPGFYLAQWRHLVRLGLVSITSS